MDALTFIISVKSEGAISAVQQLKTSMAGLQSMAHQLKTISLVNMAQGLGEFSTGIKELVGPGADFQQSMADLSAITGIAGPGGGTPDKPVGLVFVAVAGPRGECAERLLFTGDRDAIRRQAADAALRMLLAAVTEHAV